MINQESSLLKNALNFGAMTGLAISVVQLLLFTLGFGDSSFTQWLVLILGISWGSRMYRDRALGGYISYEQSLGFGVLVSLGASVVFAFFYYVYMKYINHDAFTEMLEQMQIDLYKSEISDSDREDIIKILPSLITPGSLSVAHLFLYFLFGAIVSLISSFFIKNPKSMFED